jgi:D-aminopeptidase
LKPTRLRDLGLKLGSMPTGRHNAITDVAGVEVGYAQAWRDEPSFVRSGVTAIWPRRDIWDNSAFAGIFSFNGYGEMTGIPWIEEQGLIEAPICITNTYSVGIVRDALVAYGLKHARGRDYGNGPIRLHMPVVTETFDGFLSDIDAQTVTADHTWAALDAATGGAIAEGNVGGGSGMIAHEFKGGSGTASRITPEGFTVGAFVQANYGRREHFRIDGVPIGEHLGIDQYPSPIRAAANSGSIIVVIATDAPLLPIQCRRMARRATTGLGRIGGWGSNSSGDIFLAFSTGNQVHARDARHAVTMIDPDGMNPLMLAAVEATEEAILNAMTMAETMHGLKGRTAHALPLEQVCDLLNAAGRL